MQAVSTFVGGVTTVYVYDAFGNLAAEYSSQAGTSPCGTSTCYVSWDHLGSTCMLTDANGSSTVKRYDYLPFGGELLATLSGPRTTAMGYFSSADATGKTGTDGTFPDFVKTWNAYAYVGNNPLRYTDPSGMFIGAGSSDLLLARAVRL